MARNDERKNLIIRMYVIAIISLIFGIVVILFAIKQMKLSTISFKENSNIDYKVYLNKNNYYKDKYLEKDNQYIATLIKNIETNFKYKMNIPSKYKYTYDYRIAAEVEVKDVTNDNTIYKFEEDLVKKVNLTKEGNLNIDKDVKVDFPKYNELISGFKNTYDLTNSQSQLNIVLYLSVDNFKNNKKVLNNKKVAYLEIPLVENTISIDKSNAEGVTEFSINDEKKGITYLLIGILILIGGTVLILYVIYYSIKTRTAEMIYEKEIRSIKTNYDSYIQDISESYDIGTAQVIKLKSFNDILEIRDTLKQPILMLENKKKTGTFFIIPATSSIIYVFALRIVDIEAKIKGKEVPVFDITEIPHSEFKANKKYTEDYIKEEITKTSLMPKVDENNIIKGKTSDKDLYEQLELTRSFSVDEIKKAVKKAKKRKDNRKKEKADKKD